MSRAYIALGANLGDPAATVEAAFAALANLPSSQLLARSRLYRTAPVGITEQPEFVNAAAALETSLAPEALLDALLNIEQDFGRVRALRNGPRTLDLDILLYADLTINSRNEDAAKVIQEKTGGAHAAVVTAVAKAAFNSAVDAVRAGGRVVAVGLPPEAMSLDIPRLVLDGIEVVGSLVGTRQDLVEAFQFAAEGKVVPKVALRPLADINTIFTEMEEGKIRGRMVIDFRR